MAADRKQLKHLDHRLSVEERVNYLVSQMTLREKIAQLLYAAPPVPRMKIPANSGTTGCI